MRRCRPLTYTQKVQANHRHTHMEEVQATHIHTNIKEEVQATHRETDKQTWRCRPACMQTLKCRHLHAHMQTGTRCRPLTYTYIEEEQTTHKHIDMEEVQGHSQTYRHGGGTKATHRHTDMKAQTTHRYTDMRGAGHSQTYRHEGADHTQTYRH